MRKLIYWITTFLLISVMCFSGFKIYDYYREVYKNNNQTQKIQKVFFAEKVQSKLPSKIDRLKIENKDAVGWLKIDGTKISYPVVQGIDNDYYLYHNFNKEKSSVGTLFVDYRNDMNGDFQNFVIYGHNRKDGSMFHDLSNYVDEPSYIKKKNVTFYSEKVEYTGEIFSAYEVDMNDTYTTPYFKDKREYDQYVNKQVKRSKVDFNVTDLKHDKLLTLSTCSKRSKNIRIVVHVILKDVTKS